VAEIYEVTTDKTIGNNQQVDLLNILFFKTESKS
jgi:hypothetical protein